ncbi:MAG: D-alanine--D-alanine ligase family protein [Candidatus Melainabacteria bacterium]|nr:D-alanine--D-alanine ligase family protein [Candidatus Melainabacteria bacterium]
MTNGSGKRKTVAVMFGGRSTEHEISIITALQVLEAMDTVKYQAIPVYIAPSGRWYTGDPLWKRDFYKGMPGTLADAQEVTLLPVPGIGGLTIIPNKSKKSGFALFGKKEESDEVIPVDIFFPAFHGSYGEDGCIQGLLELADVTYTGSDLLASAIAMSKYHCKKFLESHGIPVLPSVVLSRENMSAGGDLTVLRNQVLSAEGFDKFPLFIKPANLGSSIGIAKATDNASLDSAILQAFKYDHQIIVEPCLDNKMEINVSIMDDVEPKISVVEIPVAEAGGELTYEDKYIRAGGKKGGQLSQGMAGLSRVIDPTDLDPTIKSNAQQWALRAFKLIGCGGVARIDFMLDLNTNNLYFNEINPLPGSLAFYLWSHSKPSVLFTDLIDTMLERAMFTKQKKSALVREIGFQALLK